MSKKTHRNISRRDVVKLGVGGLVAGYGLSNGISLASTGSNGRNVAIFGGGVAGLSAALELVERGFDVTVYERKELGGKARSNTVPGTGVGRPDLPGEHGYRGFLGYYHNLHELLERIPVPEGGGVRGRLTATTRSVFSRAGGADISLAVPGATNGNAWFPQDVTISNLTETLWGLVDSIGGLGSTEASKFVNRLLVYMTSCEERRYGQWENITWSKFLKTEGASQNYDRLFGHGLTRNLAAMRAQDANANSIGIIGEATIYGVMGLGLTPGAASVDVLRGATNEMWIHPWLAHLESLGVNFQVGLTAKSIECNPGGQITSVTVQDSSGNAFPITADWYVLAMPVERAAPLMNPAVVAHDARLGGLGNVRTDWMNGMQFYMRKRCNISHGGLSYIDSPWAITSISQGQFWQRNLNEYGDGQVQDIISVAIADWITPGILFGKTARECTREEVAQEVWAQIKAHLNDGIVPLIRDEDLHSWWLDPAITGLGTSAANNDEPLLIQTPGSWQFRPNAVTGLENLFLAADYVRTPINVTTMEGANTAARMAVNGILERSGSLEARVPVKGMFSPIGLAAEKEIDRLRYRLGWRNKYDLG